MLLTRLDPLIADLLQNILGEEVVVENHNTIDSLRNSLQQLCHADTKPRVIITDTNGMSCFGLETAKLAVDNAIPSLIVYSPLTNESRKEFEGLVKGRPTELLLMGEAQVKEVASTVMRLMKVRV